MSPIRIAIVDDQQLVRGGIAMVVGSQPDLDLVWEAGDGVRAVELAAQQPVDVVIMDVRMPVLDGIEATKAIVASNAARVLILTTFDLDEYALDALRAGASGFLLKDAPGEELVAAIGHVHVGDKVLAPAMTGRLLERFMAGSARRAGDGQDLRDLLTERELEICLEVCKGSTNAEIAARLYLSEATVKTHVRAILRKIGGRDRVQIVIAAYEAGLV